MKDVQATSELHGIAQRALFSPPYIKGTINVGGEDATRFARVPYKDGTERIAAIVRDDFHHPSTSKSGQGFGISMLAAALRNVPRVTDVILNRFREISQIPQARSHTENWLENRFTC